MHSVVGKRKIEKRETGSRSRSRSRAPRSFLAFLIKSLNTPRWRNNKRKHFQVITTVKAVECKKEIDEEQVKSAGDSHWPPAIGPVGHLLGLRLLTFAGAAIAALVVGLGRLWWMRRSSRPLHMAH